jgi:hypothetical protein
MPELLARDGCRCRWCGRYVVTPRMVPPGRLVSAGEWEVVWRDEAGRTLRARRATADHLVPVADGGTSELANLALACARCNNDRGTVAAGRFHGT